MTTSEIKSFIHETIENIEDEQFLEALKVIIETKFASMPILEDWQIKAIEESEMQIENGLIISREEADKKAEEWLKSKNG